MDKEAERERNRMKSRAYRKRHPDRISERNKKYRTENPERFKEQIKNSYLNHVEKRKAYTKAYRLTHPDFNRIHHAKRDTRKTRAGGSFTRQEWQALKAKYDYTCLRCGRKEPEIKLTADHIIPITKNGSSNIDNIQPLCKSCNISKHTKIIDFRPQNP